MDDVVSTPQSADLAPDWSQASTAELCCPLCGYNLRGLEQPRCPECGFAFTWSELIRGQREKHPYVFEHHPERNVWSFWKTYWNDCRPRQFWSTLSPAQPVAVGRLVIYWIIANLTISIPFLVIFALHLFNVSPARTPYRYGYSWLRLTPAMTLGANAVMAQLARAYNQTLDHLASSALIATSLTVLIWPAFTLAFLLIFSQSMRRANIRKPHVLRAVVYGTDFGLLMTVLLVLGRDDRYDSRLPLLIIAICPVLTLYRVTFAYSRYLRFHLPFATVLTSQVMVVLVMFILFL